MIKFNDSLDLGCVTCYIILYNQEYLLSPKTIDQQSKDPINALQNTNFNCSKKHINMKCVENIPSMDPELLATISLPNLQEMKSNKG